jgi:hypothetical protein
MPTALELTPEELRRYRETLRRKPPEPVLTASEQLEREALLHRVTEAATLLKTQFGARQIVLFGSLAHNAWVVCLQEADPFLAANVVRGERLYARDEYEADEYDLYVLRRAGDLAPLERERIALILREKP